MQKTQKIPRTQKAQEGSILVVALLMLTALTVVSLATIEDSVLNIKMATNAKINTIELHNAEACRIDAQANANAAAERLNLAGSLPTADGLIDGSAPTYEDKNPEDYWKTATTIGKITDTIKDSDGNDIDIDRCNYFVEYLGTQNLVLKEHMFDPTATQEKVYVFRLTTKGAADNTSKSTVLQTIYIRRDSTA